MTFPGCRSKGAYYSVISIQRASEVASGSSQTRLNPVSDTVCMNMSKCLYNLSRSLSGYLATQSITCIRLGFGYSAWLKKLKDRIRIDTIRTFAFNRI